MPTGTQVAVDSVGKRIEAWFLALAGELASLKIKFRSGNDSAAEAFATLIEDVLAEQRAAFERYMANTAATDADRLRWLQQLGGEVARLMLRMERLDGAMPPRTSPLVSAFVRILGQLIPGRAAVITPFRQLNYEITSVYSEPFEPFGIDLAKHRFPALFIRIPTGFLDSPRNHILVAHELGHAVAADNRELVRRYAREAARARHLMRPAPGPVPTALLPSPTPPRERLEQITLLLWAQRQVPVPAAPGPGQAPTPERIQYGEILSAVTRTVQEVVAHWLEELFADSIGVCLLGPAFLFAFLDVLLPLGEPEDASNDHPPTASRIVNMHDLVDSPELIDYRRVLPVELADRLSAITTEARAALTRVPGTIGRPIEMEIYKLAHELVTAAAGDVRRVAMDYCRTRNLLYTPAHLKSDLGMYLDDLVSLRVPPLGNPPETEVSLATIFNVGQVVALANLSRFSPGDADSRKLEILDGLLLKAIELAEVQHAWETAPT